MKRFSGQEFAMLAAPILGIGVVAWWMSAHPAAPIDMRPVHLTFHVEKPTTMEAFRGGDVALVVDVKGGIVKDYWLYDSSPYIEVETSDGLKTSGRNNVNLSAKWQRNLWVYAINNTRFLLSTTDIPAGKMRFGISGGATTSYSGTQPPLIPLSGKWDVDRSKFAPFPFQKIERAPMVELRMLEVTAINKGNMTINAVFIVKDATANEETSLDCNFSEKNGRVLSYGTASGVSETSRRRVRELTLGAPFPGEGNNLPYVVTGLVNIANCWPLEFECEPFDFKTAKVGQRIQFKQFAAPLPKT